MVHSELTFDSCSKFLDVLHRHVGRANAIPLPALALECGVSGRTAQQIKQRLIVAGHPIGSSCGKPHGIFLIEDEADRREACDQLEHRIIALAADLRALDRNHWILEKLGQGEFLSRMNHPDFSKESPR